MWLLSNNEKPLQQYVCLKGKVHRKNIFIAKLKGCNDCNTAKNFIGHDIYISSNSLPFLEVGEYYWYQLIGVKVINQNNKLLGTIDYLLETGTHDVLVIKPCTNSVDTRERLLPYIKNCIVMVDLVIGEIHVNWNLDY